MENSLDNFTVSKATNLMEKKYMSVYTGDAK